MIIKKLLENIDKETRLLIFRLFVGLISVYLLTKNILLESNWDAMETICFLCVSLFFFFVMPSLGNQPKTKKPISKKIYYKSYDEMIDIISNYLTKFKDIEKIDVENANTKCNLFIHSNENEMLIVQTIWMENYYHRLFKIYDWILRKEIKKRNKNLTIKIIQYIFIQRQNDQFKRKIKLELKQEEKRYQIVVGISLGGRKAYIGKTRDKIYQSNYDELLTIVEEMMVDVFKKEENE